MIDNILKELKSRMSKNHTTKKDIQNILKSLDSGNWTAVYNSRLYNKYGVEYCVLLEVINSLAV